MLVCDIFLRGRSRGQLLFKLCIYFFSNHKVYICCNCNLPTNHLFQKQLFHFLLHAAKTLTSVKYSETLINGNIISHSDCNVHANNYVRNKKYWSIKTWRLATPVHLLSPPSTVTPSEMHGIYLAWPLIKHLIYETELIINPALSARTR